VSTDPPPAPSRAVCLFPAPPTPQLHPLSLHDALPIYSSHFLSSALEILPFAPSMLRKICKACLLCLLSYIKSRIRRLTARSTCCAPTTPTTTSSLSSNPTQRNTSLHVTA